MIWMTDLFPGTDRLVNIAHEMKLDLENRKKFTPETSHQRDILVFRKPLIY